MSTAAPVVEKSRFDVTLRRAGRYGRNTNPHVQQQSSAWTVDDFEDALFTLGVSLAVSMSTHTQLKVRRAGIPSRTSPAYRAEERRRACSRLSALALGSMVDDQLRDRNHPSSVGTELRVRQRLQSHCLSQRFRSSREELERPHVLCEPLDDVASPKRVCPTTWVALATARCVASVAASLAIDASANERSRAAAAFHVSSIAASSSVAASANKPWTVCSPPAPCPVRP